MPAMATDESTLEVLREAYQLAKQRQGMTQKRLANILGVEQQTVSGYLTGAREPGARMFFRFLGACNAPQRLYLALRDGYGEAVAQTRP